MTTQMLAFATAQPSTAARATVLASGCLALLAAWLGSGAQAEELQPVQDRSIALGPDQRHRLLH